MWCAGISLLDQLSSGQVIVYVVAVISVAITPFFEPLTLLLMYLAVHSLFLIAMPYFKESDELRLINMQLQKANKKLEIMSMTDSLT